MAKELFVSKAFAIGVVTLTASSIAGIITMVVVYQLQLSKMNPTPRPPTLPPTTYPTGPPPNLRLPENLVPGRYLLYLKPHLYSSLNYSDVNVTEQTLLFTGNSTVFFQCVQKTWSIFLHSKNLTLLKVSVMDQDAGKLLPSEYEEYTDGTDFLEVKMKEGTLAEGKNYSLFVDFKGEMQNDLTGMYINSYEEDGLTKYVTTTQLEPTDARKVFPCFDEPALKATFDVTIIHRLSTTALGNWGKDGSGSGILDDEWKFTTFKTTKPMSTYLLAFAVSEFPYAFTEITEGNRKIEIRTYTRKEAYAANQALYANGIAGDILGFFIRRFGNYSLNKLDQFVVPDHRAAAMENWGLVVYEEGSLLYDEKSCSPLHKEDIVDLVAHELAHQWFGNLVTMKWWNDVWLNEGFSTYMANLGVAHAEPDWNIKDLRDMSHRLSAFEVDALNSSHPLTPPAEEIQTYDQIAQMFSTITYFKGATVLRMLADAMTEPAFHAGVKLYLNELQYENAGTQDVWKYMQKAHDKAGVNDIADIAAMMNTWTQQIGYPVLTINTTDGAVSQKQFTLNPSTESGRVWTIPIRVRSAIAASQSLILLAPDSPVRIDDFRSKKGEWILANIDATGYYRVNYNPENWRSLMDELETNFAAIPVMNRGQLIDDAFNLARAKLVNVTLALNITRYLRKDTECIPWQTTIKNLKYFVDMFDRSIVYGPMQVYMQKLVEPLYEHFSNDTNISSIPTDHCQQRNQLLAIHVACSNGLPACTEMAKQMFAQWMNDTENSDINRIPSNMRPVIYCQGVAAGGYEEWMFVWKMYKSQGSVDLFNALCCTNKIWLLNSLLDYTLDPVKGGHLDVLGTIRIIGQNPVGQSLAWDFVRAHWTSLQDMYGGGVSYLLRELAARFNTDFALQELKQFQTTQNAMEDMLMNQAIEATEANVLWVKENKLTVLKWFLRELSGDSSGNGTVSI